MSERYSNVFTLQQNLYAVGSPVLIAAGTLLKDNQTGRVVAQLKFRSISNNIIKAVKVKLDLFDTAGNPIAESVVFDYLDLSASRDAEFGQKTPVPVPENKARSYKAAVTEVVFADKSIWTATGEAWEPLSSPAPLTISDPELLNQYQLRFGSNSRYTPKEEKGLWHCTCGALNHAGENCHVCRNSLFELQTVDMAELEADKDARLEQEAKQVAEKKAAAEIQRQKNKKTLSIVTAAVCAVVALMLLVAKVIVPNNEYNAAVALMEAGQYSEAIAAFEAMEGYKDSEEQIVNCEKAIVDAELAKAEELLAAGDYDGAMAIFESLSNAEGVERVETAKLVVAYRTAEALAENGETAKAAIEFGKLGNYSDAHNRSMELWNQVAARETIVVSTYNTVGLKSDGTVVAVGTNDYGQCNVANWRNIIDIASSSRHSVGLKSDGTVVAVGSDKDLDDKRIVGQCDVTAWTDIVDVVAGYYHTVGLRSDGTVVAVGDNQYGQCNVSGWSDIIAIDSGGWQTIGLRSDGTVVATGYNEDGRCNVSGWADIVAVVSGGVHTVALRSDGTVVAVGSNQQGQCDVTGWTDIVAISADSLHTVGLKSDGTVVTTSDSTDVSDWTDIIAISAGWASTVGLKSDGTVMAVTFHDNGQCNVSGWTDIVAIDTDIYHTVGLKSDGTVVAVGKNKEGQCNVSNWTNIKVPN